MEVIYNYDFINFKGSEGRPLQELKVYFSKKEIEFLKHKSKDLSQIIGKKITVSQIIRIKLFYDYEYKDDDYG